MIFWNILAFILIIIILFWFLFQPLNFILPTGNKHHPNKEVHEMEDLKQFSMEDNLDLKAHFQAQEEDTIM